MSKDEAWKEVVGLINDFHLQSCYGTCYCEKLEKDIREALYV